MALTDGIKALLHSNADFTDASGNGNNATAYGAVIDTTNKKLGAGSGSFDGIDDHADIPFSSSIDLASATTYGLGFSVSVWIRPMKNFTAPGRIFDQRLNSDSAALYVYGNVYLYTTLNNQGLGPSPVMTQGTWYHAVWVYDRVGAMQYLYLNGSLTNSRSQTGTITTRSKPLTLGIYNDGGAGHYYKGNLDEFVIWNRPLTAAEVSELYNGGAGVELGVVSVTPQALGVQTSVYAPSVSTVWNQAITPGGFDIDICLPVPVVTAELNHQPRGVAKAVHETPCSKAVHAGVLAKAVVHARADVKKVVI